MLEFAHCLHIAGGPIVGRPITTLRLITGLAVRVRDWKKGFQDK